MGRIRSLVSTVLVLYLLGACGGPKLDDIVVKNCEGQGNSLSVCECVAEKVKLNTEKEMYERYVSLLETVDRLGTERGIKEQAAELNSGDFMAALKFQQQMISLIGEAGKEIGLTEMETLGIVTSVKSIQDNAIGGCRS